MIEYVSTQQGSALTFVDKTETILYSNSQLLIGRYVSLASHYNGDIDDVRIYIRALSQTDARVVYRGNFWYEVEGYYYPRQRSLLEVKSLVKNPNV